MKHTIYLSRDMVSVLQRDLKQSTREDLLRTELACHCDDLGPLLGPYCQDKLRGTVFEDTIEIAEDGVLLKDETHGTVFIEFSEEAHYGCKDMNDVHDHSPEIPFTLDLSGGTLVLHGMEEQIREPDEV
jgi:hypothetical protein